MNKNKNISQQTKNYKNFGLAVLIIIGVIIFFLVICAIAHFGFLHGVADGKGVDFSAYNAGKEVGYSLRVWSDFYLKSGLIFGNLLALVASLEKRNSFHLVLLHGFLGWGYVIYYTLTRKTIFTN